MAMWSEDDETLDTAIDEVARQLTDGATVPTFRAHVLKRIREGDRARWRMEWTWFPVTIAAAVVLLLIVRATWQAGLNSHLSTLNEPRAMSHEPRPTTNDQRPATSDQRPIARRSRGGSPSPIDALAPERLAVASIAIDALAPAESIQLSEMKVSSIDVAPLAVEGRQPQ